ncbi:RluA family pseudouridine synthase [bacterium]|nr:RluA family pseudouridine synthase [bacterium]
MGNKIYEFVVDEESVGDRIDLYLGGQIPELSRSRIQKAIKSGEVLIDGGEVKKAAYRVSDNERISLKFTPPEPMKALPEDIPLSIVYEDKFLIVLDKPPGLVVHPAPGHWSGTLVNALLYHCDDLSGIGGILRPGIVHRLDKNTSGLIVVAKNDEVHLSLSRQLMERTVSRVYHTIIWGEMPVRDGVIDQPIGRSRRNRKKMAVVKSGGRNAVTNYNVMDTFPPFQYIKVKLGTGRTHQIRVHLSHFGRPVLGDPDYGGRKLHRGGLSDEERKIAKKALSVIDRQALHAVELSFYHPIVEKEMSFKTVLPDDFESVLSVIKG